MAEGKTTTKPTDKRIASLEAGVASLGLALSANGVTLEEGADPIVAAIVAIKATGEVRAQLATCTEEITAARKRVTELEQENLELEVDLEEVTNARNALANQLAENGKPSTPPASEDPKPKVDEMIEALEERPEIARDVGPEFARLTEPAIAALIADGGEFEVAFSNGSFELAELSIPPIKIKGSDLQRVEGGRYCPKPAIHVRGSVSARIHGAGLLYRGEQVAYHQFSPAVVIQAGQERRFDRALMFG